MATKLLAPLIPAGDFPVTEAGFVGVDDERLDDVLAAIQQAQSSVDSQITEMQSQISALGKTIKIKGRVNTVNDLPGTASEGDMYFVGAETAESFEEYVFTAQNKWEHLGSINDIDLSDYVTKTFLSGELLGYAKLSDIPTVPTNYLTGGSQTSKSTADGGKNVYTFTKSDGTTSTLEVLNGTKGSNGVSCTHSWNGTTLTVTSASGTSSENLKGDAGAAGTNGKDGVTPTIKAANGTNIGSVGTPSVSASTSGTTTTFTFNYLKGAKGDKGDPGQNATTTSTATQSANGLMSADDKKKLDGVAAGATAVTTSTVSGWGYAKKNSSNSFNGEQKFEYANYCPTAVENADAIGCAFKSSRVASNQIVLGEIIMPNKTAQDADHSIDGEANKLKLEYVESVSNGIPKLKTEGYFQKLNGWVGRVNGHTVDADVPSDAVFHSEKRIIDVNFKNVSFSSGTVGSRGIQKYVELSLNAGETITGCYIRHIGNGSSANAIITPLFTNSGNNTVVLNLYRTTTSSFSADSIVVRVIVDKVGNISNVTVN